MTQCLDARRLSAGFCVVDGSRGGTGARRPVDDKDGPWQGRVADGVVLSMDSMGVPAPYLASISSECPVTR